jgi:hypothetical protein
MPQPLDTWGIKFYSFRPYVKRSSFIFCSITEVSKSFEINTQGHGLSKES